VPAEKEMIHRAQGCYCCDHIAYFHCSSHSSERGEKKGREKRKQARPCQSASLHHAAGIKEEGGKGGKNLRITWLEEPHLRLTTISINNTTLTKGRSAADHFFSVMRKGVKKGEEAIGRA